MRDATSLTSRCCCFTLGRFQLWQNQLANLQVQAAAEDRPIVQGNLAAFPANTNLLTTTSLPKTRSGLRVTFHHGITWLLTLLRTQTQHTSFRLHQTSAAGDLSLVYRVTLLTTPTLGKPLRLAVQPPLMRSMPCIISITSFSRGFGQLVTAAAIVGGNTDPSKAYLTVFIRQPDR